MIRYRMLCQWVLLIAMLSWPAVAAAQPGKPTPIPANAKITLTSDKTTYFLGENILLHYHVSNTGGPDFTISSGGDYRGTRPIRFVVIAQDENNNPVLDPYPVTWDMGGFVVARAITPDKPWASSVQLSEYRDIQSPGTYTIHVWHDLGWNFNDKSESRRPEAKLIAVDKNDRRWTTITLIFNTPDKAEAAKVFDAMSKLSTERYYSLDSTTKPFADYSCLKLPVYMPLLTKAIADGNKDAVHGLGSIYIPKATHALLSLLNHPNPDMVMLAYDALIRRIPIAPNDRPWMSKASLQQQERRVAQSWRPDMTAPLLNFAKQSLQKTVDNKAFNPSVLYPTRFIAAVATPLELPDVTACLDAIILRSTKYKTNDQLGSEVGFLRFAVNALLLKGATPPANPQSPGEIAVYLEALRASLVTQEQAMPHQQVWLKHAITYVRRMAVESLPVPMENWAKEPVLKLLQNTQDHGEQKVLLNTIEKSPEPMFAKEALTALRETKEDFFLLDAASNTALACGVPRDEVLLALADRLLTPPNHFSSANQHEVTLRELYRLFENFNGGYGPWSIQPAQQVALHKRWTTFIHANQEALRQGKKIPITDPSVSPDLIPKGHVLSIGQERWPPQT